MMEEEKETYRIRQRRRREEEAEKIWKNRGREVVSFHSLLIFLPCMSCIHLPEKRKTGVTGSSFSFHSLHTLHPLDQFLLLLLFKREDWFASRADCIALGEADPSFAGEKEREKPREAEERENDAQVSVLKTGFKERKNRQSTDTIHCLLLFIFFHASALLPLKVLPRETQGSW